MKTFSGKGVGERLENVIRGSNKFLIVISPWISDKYASIIMSKVKDGVKAIVVTSEDSEKAFRKAMRGCEKKERSKRSLLFWALALPLTVVALIALLREIGLLLSVIVIIASLKRRKKGYGKGNRIKVIIVGKDHFVHAKIYVNESKAVTGSANLTESGLWRNVELIHIFDKGEEGYEEVFEEAKKIVRESEANSKKLLRC